MPDITPPPLFDPRVDVLRADFESTRAMLNNVLVALNEVLVLHEELLKQQHATQAAALKDTAQVQLEWMRQRTAFTILMQALTAPRKQD